MFAIWFLFDKSDHEYLSQIINKLSNINNCPIFIPHITAYGVINTRLEKIDTIISNSIKGIKPFMTEKNKLSFSNDFWKTIFIDIFPNSNLLEIHKKLKDNLPVTEKYDFKPHISLMYKDISNDEKEKIVDSLIIKNSFKISKLGVQRFSEDIKKWKIVREYSLN